MALRPKKRVPVVRQEREQKQQRDGHRCLLFNLISCPRPSNDRTEEIKRAVSVSSRQLLPSILNQEQHTTVVWNNYGAFLQQPELCRN